jgi:hypothetical protein
VRGPTAGRHINGTPSAGKTGSRPKVTEAEAVEAVDRAARRGAATHRSQRDGVTEIPYTRLGMRIFGAILILTALMLVALVVYAVVTYPTASDARAILGSATSGSTALNDWQDMQSQWFDQVTRLGQILIFGSVLPLLATVVGYLLGERRGGT